MMSAEMPSLYKHLLSSLLKSSAACVHACHGFKLLPVAVCICIVTFQRRPEIMHLALLTA